MSTPRWSIECDYMESCNCDFGCTCNFSGIPTGGRCEALVGYHVRKGNFGDVSLDGLDFIYAASWPRAIHQGDGTMRLYISDRGTEQQRKAITEIAYGRAAGSGAFAVFATTMRYKLDPEIVPIAAGLRSLESWMCSFRHTSTPCRATKMTFRSIFPMASSGKPRTRSSRR
jgi:hypothetical protein